MFYIYIYNIYDIYIYISDLYLNYLICGFLEGRGWFVLQQFIKVQSPNHKIHKELEEDPLSGSH